MIKLTFVITFVIIWFLFSGFYIVPKNDFESWLYSSILYMIGMLWVIPFLLNKSMTMPNASPELTPEAKYKWQRLFLFFIGIIISLSATIF